MKFTTLLTAAALTVAGTFQVAAEELSFANFTPPFHTVNASVIEKLNADLSAATGGDLTVRGYHGGELGAGPVEQYVRVVQGVADIAWGLPGYTSSQFEKTMIIELPGTLDINAPGYTALWGAYADHLASEFPATKPVALWTSEPNIFIMNGHEIRTPADMKGLKVRVAGATAAEVAEAMGATPVQMPINQVYNAMQTGLIDGVITGSSTLNDFKLNEVATSITLNANLGRLAFYAVMGQAKYDGLTDAQKAAIDAASGLELSKSAEDAWRATSAEGIEAAKAGGKLAVIELSADEAQAFADVVGGVTDAYVASVGGAAALAAMQAN